MLREVLLEQGDVVESMVKVVKVEEEGLEVQVGKEVRLYVIKMEKLSPLSAEKTENLVVMESQVQSMHYLDLIIIPPF